MNKTIAQIKLEMLENPVATRKGFLIAFCVISVFTLCLFLILISVDSSKIKIVINEKEKPSQMQLKESGDFSFGLYSDGKKVSITTEENSENINPASSTEYSADKLFTRVSRVKSGMESINGIFYLLGLLFSLQYASSCMLNDRRDQSILFFKSLPISEWQIVLTRLGVAAFLIPFAALVGAFATTFVYLLMASVFSSTHTDLSFFHLFVSINPLYNLLVMLIKTFLAGIWALPLLAWMFLAGAWSKKHPIMLAVSAAVFVLTFLALIEYGVFGGYSLGSGIAQYFNGFSIGGGLAIKSQYLDYSFSGILDFILRPGLWLGLITAAFFIQGTVYLRNHRFEL